MTPTSPGRQPPAPVRAWRGFRRWRRGRPFWGGLWTLVSGVWIFLSTQLDLGSIQIRMGEEGFQSLVIPAVLAIAGLLLWFSPAQRVFYGVIAAIVAVASLVLVNLGGFLLGALFGMVGGALGCAWTPRQPAVGADAVPEEEGAPDDGTSAGSATDERTVAYPHGLEALFPAGEDTQDLGGTPGDGAAEQGGSPGTGDDTQPRGESAAGRDTAQPDRDAPAGPGDDPGSGGDPRTDRGLRPEGHADTDRDAGAQREGNPDADEDARPQGDASAGRGANPGPDPDGGSTVPVTRPSYGGPLGDTLPTGTVSPLAAPGEGADRDAGPQDTRSGQRDFPGRFAKSLSAEAGPPSGQDGADGTPAATVAQSGRDGGDAPADATVAQSGRDGGDAPADATVAQSGRDGAGGIASPAAGGADDAPPDPGRNGRRDVAGPDAPIGDRPPAGRRPPAGLVVMLVALSAALTGLSLARHATPASAAPCPPGATAPAGAGSLAPSGGSVPSSAASPSAAAADALGVLESQITPSPTVTAEASGVATSPTPAVDPSASPSTAEPSAGPSTAPATSAAPSASATPQVTAPASGACDRPATAAPAAGTLAAAADQPLVNGQPSRMTAASLTMSGLSYDGVVDLPTRDGTIRTLRFSMDKTVSKPFDLRVSQDGRTADLRSDQLTVSGSVIFYTSRFEAKLDGVDPVTFTPDSPPVAILPDPTFTDATIDLVYVTGGILTASNLDISA